MAPLTARGFAYERTEEHRLGDGPVAVTMAPGECRAVVAAGGATLLDVDLVVRDANGGRVASDRGPAPWAGVTFCAPEEGEASLFVDVVRYRGQGPVRLEWMRGS